MQVNTINLINTCISSLQDDWYPYVSGRKLSKRTQRVWNQTFSNQALQTIPFTILKPTISIQTAEQRKEVLSLSSFRIKKIKQKTGEITNYVNKEICEECNGKLIFYSQYSSLVCTGCGIEQFYQEEFPETLYNKQYNFSKPKNIPASNQIIYRFQKFLYASYGQDYFAFTKKRNICKLIDLIQNIPELTGSDIKTPIDTWKVLRKHKEHYWCEHFVCVWYYSQNKTPPRIVYTFFERVVDLYKKHLKTFLEMRKSTKRYNCLHKPYICLVLCQKVSAFVEFTAEQIPDPIIKLPKGNKTQIKLQRFFESIPF